MITKRIIDSGFILESNASIVKVITKKFQNKNILTISVEDKKSGDINFFRTVDAAIRILKKTM